MWGLLFLVLAYVSMAMVFVSLFDTKDADPPTALLFVGVMILCPLAGTTGIVLGFLRKLPGTK